MLTHKMAPLNTSADGVRYRGATGDNLINVAGRSKRLKAEEDEEKDKDEAKPPGTSPLFFCFYLQF